MTEPEVLKNRIPIGDGKCTYAYGGVVGIGKDLEVWTGWDGHLEDGWVEDGEGLMIFDEGGAAPKLTKEQRLYICDIAIGRWEALREKLRKGE